MAFTRTGTLSHAALSGVTAAQHHTATVGAALALADLATRAHSDLSDAPTSAHHVLYTNAEAVAAVEADAVLTIQGQIAFPATLNASAGANVLDDYEEGTWTPQIADSTGDGSGESQAYSAQVGTYTKIGRHVFIQGNVVTSSIGSLTTGNQVEIVGLPFPHASLTGGETAVYFSTGRGLAIAAQDTVTAHINDNAIRMPLQLWDAADGTTTMSVAEWSANGGIHFACQYRT